MMTVDEFGTALDRFGSDLDRWPGDLRREAEALAASSPEAAARLGEARRLHDLLHAAVAAEPVDAARIGRILARARGAETGGERPMRAGSRFYVWAGGGLAACLAAGFLIGHAVPGTYGEEQIAQLLFSDVGLSAIGVEQ